MILHTNVIPIIGFSFYLDGFMEGCKSGIEKEEGKTEQQFADKCFVSKRHVQKNMWNFCRQTLIDNPRVNLDSVLNNILQLQEFSRSCFTQAAK